MRRRDTVSTPASTLRGRVLDVLKSEGFIRGYTEGTADNGSATFEIELKYSDNLPVIRTIERVSRPGRRVYASVRNIPQVAQGLGVSIMSTPKGVMADHEARSQNLGGEVLCRVF
jgi:small subunit ribosomal protein S8